MEDLFGIQNHRQGVAENIQKALGAGYEPEGTDENTNIQKARVGVYKDNAKNRRLNRVGQQYGEKKEEEMPKGKTQAKKEDEPNDKKGASEKQNMSSHAAKASDGALKRAAADENAPKHVRDAANAELKKRGKNNKDDDGSGILNRIKNRADKNRELSEKNPEAYRFFDRLEVYSSGKFANKELQNDVKNIAEEHGWNNNGNILSAMDYLRENANDNKLRNKLVDAYTNREGSYEDEDSDRNYGKKESKKEIKKKEKQAVESARNDFQKFLNENDYDNSSPEYYEKVNELFTEQKKKVPSLSTKKAGSISGANADASTNYKIELYVEGRQKGMSESEARVYSDNKYKAFVSSFTDGIYTHTN